MSLVPGLSAAETPSGPNVTVIARWSQGNPATAPLRRSRSMSVRGEWYGAGRQRVSAARLVVSPRRCPSAMAGRRWPRPQLLLGRRGQRDGARRGDGGKSRALHVRGGIFPA